MTALASSESPLTMFDNARILVVDDEESIRISLEAVLRDAGYEVVHASHGEQALGILSDQRIDLVLLDIWMPGVDGVEVLKRIRNIWSNLPVVMMSGHATIATAVSATKLGATEFVEKPLDLHTTVEAVRRSLAGIHKDATDMLEPKVEDQDITALSALRDIQITPVVFTNQKMRGRALPQKTLAHSALLYGQGLHSGRKSGLILEPLPPNSGIHFAGVSEPQAVPAHVDYVESTGFATTVRLGATSAATVEHLMSALNAYGICNLMIKCNGEVPVMDGSALEFCKLFEEVGVKEQDGSWFEIQLDRILEIGNPSGEFIRAEPSEEFTIDYTLRYPEPIGEQHFVFTLDSAQSYRDLIAPCRTFGFVKDIGYLQRQGLALGGRFDNFVLIGPNGTVNDSWRFADEPVRHKILDCIGDLFLLGRRLRAKITACMTGHSDNIKLLAAVGDLLKE